MKSPTLRRNDIATMLLDRVGDQRLGLRTCDRDWTWDQVVGESAARAILAGALRDENFSATAFHVGVLLENVPDFVFWLGAAALAGATVVGLNPTRGSDGLAADIRHADCQLIVTDAPGIARLQGLDLGLDPSRFLLIDDPEYRRRVDVDYCCMPLFSAGTPGEPVYRWAGRGRPEYQRMTDDDRHALDAEFAEHGRTPHVGLG